MLYRLFFIAIDGWRLELIISQLLCVLYIAMHAYYLFSEKKAPNVYLHSSNTLLRETISVDMQYSTVFSLYY